MKLISEKRPELKSRLVTAPIPTYSAQQTIGATDLKRVQDVTGFDPKEYHTLEETFLDTIDSLLELEKVWIANGHEVYVPASGD